MWSCWLHKNISKTMSMLFMAITLMLLAIIFNRVITLKKMMTQPLKKMMRANCLKKVWKKQYWCDIGRFTRIISTISFRSKGKVQVAIQGLLRSRLVHLQSEIKRRVGSNGQADFEDLFADGPKC